MTSAKPQNSGLQWDVLTVKRPGLYRDLPPGKEDLAWVANSSTPIHGARDASAGGYVSDNQTSRARWWIGLPAAARSSSPSISTHGHGDHFFGLGAALLERFPAARAVAHARRWSRPCAAS